MSGSSMFVVETGPRAEVRTKDLAVEVTTLLHATDYAAFWHLSDPGDSDRACTLNNILKNLIYQALRHDPTIVASEPTLGNIHQFQMEHKLEEWLSLACIVFSRIPKCFVVVETEKFYRISGRNSAVVQQVLDVFRRLLESVAQGGGVMKLLIVSYGLDSSAHVLLANTPLIVAAIGQMLPVSRRAKHLLRAGSSARLQRHRFNPMLVAPAQVQVSKR